MNTYWRTVSAVMLVMVLSCVSKKEDIPKTKTIERALIVPEMILQKTGVEYRIAVRYFKDYLEKDHVSLSINGQRGTIVKEEQELLTGTTLLFMFPAIQEIGEQHILLSIDNGQDIFEQQQKLRFVADYTLNAVWESFSEGYLSLHSAVSSQLKGGGIAIDNLGNTASMSGTYYHPIGVYFLSDMSHLQRENKPFLEGLSGSYHIAFSNAMPQEIMVKHGEPHLTPDYRAENTHVEIKSVPGSVLISSEQINNFLVTTYQIGSFLLRVHENSEIVYTLVNKVTS